MFGLIIEHLTKSFDDEIVLEDFQLEVAAGELLVVLGPSGCGKSTLLRLIAGLENPDEGRIILDGRDITDVEPQKRKTAMVFQNYALYPHMTVFENMSFPLRVARTSKTEMVRIVGDTARLLELDKLLDRRPAQLSGGQRQRVALGRGLVRQPSIFLLDEPLSNLDAALRLKMRQEILALQKRLGITMIYVTHDQVEALTMADRMVVLRNGRILQKGQPAEIYKDPHDSFVASFIGTPPINLFVDTIKEGRLEKLPVSADFKWPAGRYLIGIRPEHLECTDQGSIEGKIEAIEYTGAVSHLTVAVGELRLIATIGHGVFAKEIGQTVNLAVDPDNILFFDPESGRRLYPD